MARPSVLLAQIVRRHRRTVFVIWLVLFLAALPFAAHESEHLTGGGFNAPGSQSLAVENVVASDFQGGGSGAVALVLVPRHPTTTQNMVEAIDAASRKIDGIKGISVPAAAIRQAEAAMRPPVGLPVLLPVNVPAATAESQSKSISLAQQMRHDLGITGSQPGTEANGTVEVHVLGQGALFAAFQNASKVQLATAEAHAFPLIAIVLLLVFGSLVAASLPIGLSVVALVLTSAIIFLLSLATEMSIFATSIASLVGIGVGVDYSLFLLARYREEIRAGRDRETALDTTLATSGVAVLFSGLTVIVSVSALFLIPVTALRSMAIGAIVVVAVALLAVSTLLPALISVAGERVAKPGWIRQRLSRRRNERAGEDPAFWSRWTEAVMRRPLLSVAGCLVVMLAIASPAIKLRMETSALNQLSPNSEYRQGVAAANSLAEPGALGPVQVVGTFVSGTASDPANQRAEARLVVAVAADPEVKSVGPPVVGANGQRLLLTAVLRVDPESQAGRTTVTRLRHDVATEAAIHVDVGGSTAQLVDFDSFVTSSLWKILLFISIISLIVLAILLRSIILPIKAVLLNLLSVAASYGVLVAVFQWGWLSFLGLNPTPYVDTVTPPLVLVIAYGLSMDYEVFLLSRIRERYQLSGDNRLAVAEGLSSSAGTITSAALIMVIVFIAFVSAAIPAVQRIGLALASAIILDATLVRLVLVPAAMELLGEWNWWLPKSLRRLLPQGSEQHLALQGARPT